MTLLAPAERRWQFWIDRGGTFTDVIARDPWQPLASFTRTVTEVEGLADAVGVPLITPVLALSVRPAGSVPAVTVHEL